MSEVFHPPFFPVSLPPRARRGICLRVGTDRRRILGKRVGGQCETETASLAKKELSVRKDISDAAAMMTQPSQEGGLG